MIHQLCRIDAGFRERVLEKCRKDPAWFINAFVWTFDPRPDVEQHDLPFILYDFQIDLIRRIDRALERKEDLYVEKSRDMGVTWVILSWGIHGFLFRDGFQFLIGSRKEDLVDNRTLDSHFGKLEYILQKLPGWLLPKGFNFDRHRMKLKLINPENGNTIIGESANAQFSRQGRYTAILYDEAAFWPDFTKAWRAGAEATRTRIGVSTPNGMNSWGHLIHMPQNQNKRVTLHWTLHPKKDQSWYEYQKSRMTEEDLAQEVDISYQRSVRGVVYPTWVHVPKGVYPFEPRWHLYVSWDFGLDETAMIWWLRDPVTGRVRATDCYRNQQKPITFYIPFVTGSIPAGTPRDEYTSYDLAKIAAHAQFGPAIHFGDPSVRQRNVASGYSAMDVLAEHGIYIVTNEKAKDFKTRRTAAELGFRDLEVNINPDGPLDCSELDEAMKQARYPERRDDSQSTSEVRLPVHDWTSHLRSALEYFFVNLPPKQRFPRPEPEVTKMAYDDL